MKYTLLSLILIWILSVVGLIWWEFEQENGELIFDKSDICATIEGVLSGYLILLLAFRNLLDIKDIINEEDKLIA